MANFRIGDVVELKSGGPKMTVDRILGDSGQRLTCVWFIGTQRNEGQFSLDSLKPWKDEEPKFAEDFNG
jgi:uncharacterized protein YodC (DUF2158 family)